MQPPMTTQEPRGSSTRSPSLPRGSLGILLPSRRKREPCRREPSAGMCGRALSLGTACFHRGEASHRPAAETPEARGDLAQWGPSFLHVSKPRAHL